MYRGQNRGGIFLLFFPIQANGLIVIDSNSFENLLLNQTFQNRAIDLAKKFSRVNRVLGNDDKSIVVDHVAFEVFGAARVLTILHGTL